MHKFWYAVAAFVVSLFLGGLFIGRGIVPILYHVPFLIGVVVIIFVYVMITPGSSYRVLEPLSPRGILAAVVSIVLFGLLLTYYSWGKHEGLVAKFEQPNYTSTIPEIRPRGTAYEIAKSALSGLVGNDSTTTVGDVDAWYIAETNELFWITPKEPANKLNPYFGQVEELIVLDDAEQTKIIEQTFAVGEGMLIFDNPYWSVLMKRYLSEIADDDVFYWQLPSQNDRPGEVVIVAPLLRYSLHHVSPVKVWDGVIIIYPSGETEYLSPRRATTDPRFKNAHMYPPSLVTKQVENSCYRFSGLMNCWFGNKEAFDVPTFPNSNNTQPYYGLVDFGSGLEPAWIITADPDGDLNKTTVRLFIQDVDSPKWTIVDTTRLNIMGPDKAISQVRNNVAGFIWAEDGAGTHIVMEPRPGTKDGQYYWVTSITIKDDFTSTAALAVVNGTTNEVSTFCSAETMFAWFDGSTITESTPCANSGNNEPQAPVQVAPAPLEQLDYSEMSDDELVGEYGAVVVEMINRGLLTIEPTTVITPTVAPIEE